MGGSKGKGEKGKNKGDVGGGKAPRKCFNCGIVGRNEAQCLSKSISDPEEGWQPEWETQE